MVKIKMNPGARRILLFLFMALLAVFFGLMPAPKKAEAQEQHEVYQEATAKEKEIEQAMEGGMPNDTDAGIIEQINEILHDDGDDMW